MGNYIAMIRWFVLLNLLCLGVWLPAYAQKPSCEPGNPKNSGYMLRPDQKRCEGTKPEGASRDFNLRSLAIGQIPLANQLSLRVPRPPNWPEPTIEIRSPKDFYYLDPLDLTPSNQAWQFQWSGAVLRSKNIDPSSLRSLAMANGVVFPIWFSKSPRYEIRFFTGGWAKTITLRILQGSTEIYRQTLINQPGDEVAFSWNGRNRQNRVVPTGQYTIEVKALVEQPKAPPRERDRTRQFFHDPAWLN